MSFAFDASAARRACAWFFAGFSLFACRYVQGNGLSTTGCSAK